MSKTAWLVIAVLIVAAGCQSAPTATIVPIPAPSVSAVVPPAGTAIPPSATAMPTTFTAAPLISTPSRAASPTIAPAQQKNKVHVVMYDMSSHPDIPAMKDLSTELGFSFEKVDYKYINDGTNWFNQNGNRKVDIFVIAGGHFHGFFDASGDAGISVAGCQNLKNFINQGGSVLALDGSGVGVFVNTDTTIGLNESEVKKGVAWAPLKHPYPGAMVNTCGGEPLFKGNSLSPIESNIPYPRVRFIPVRLNPDNPIVKQAQVPNTVYLFTEAGPDILPDGTQAVEQIGWWPDGQLAIGIVKYGSGSVYLIGPHPDLNIIGDGLDSAISIMRGAEGDRMGVPPAMREESVATLKKEGDPDTGVPDLQLMKALMRDAASRASSQ